jgi:hypothetical protein
VAFDFLSQQWPGEALGNEGVQDYLHEMALADSPPSGTFYDPENDGAAMASQGVHEHWNNATDKQYTRYLGTGSGIELVYLVGSPTVVMLARFEAWPEGRRTIHVQWETSQEIDNLGFNLYRSSTRSGPRLKLSKALIPSLVPPGSPFGAVYDWADENRLRSGRLYFYWLEDMDIYGRTTMHGPVMVKMPNR